MHCRCGEIGRHKGLKIPRSNIRTGSSPVSGTRKRKLSKEGLRFFVALPHNSMAK